MQRQVASEGTAVFGTFILLFYLDFMFCFVLFCFDVLRHLHQRQVGPPLDTSNEQLRNKSPICGIDLSSFVCLICY